MTPVAGLDDGFYAKLLQGAAAIGVHPISMALVMAGESSLYPSIIAANGAVGLNMFMPEQLANVTGGMAAEDYAALPASSQLDYVFRFWSPIVRANPGARLGGARDLYWLNFLPGTYVADAPDDHLIVPSKELTDLGWSAARQAGVLRDNPALRSRDDSGEGLSVEGLPGQYSIRASDMKRALDVAAARMGGRWNAVVQNLQEAAGGGLPPIPTNASLASLTSHPSFLKVLLAVTLLMGLGTGAFYVTSRKLSGKSALPPLPKTVTLPRLKLLAPRFS